MKNTICIAALLVLAGPAFAKHDKISNDLDSVAANAYVNVIVQFTDIPNQGQLKKVLGNWGSLAKQLSAFKGATISVPASVLPYIASIPGVKFITPDRKLKGMLDYTDAAVNATEALSLGWNGANIGIAVIDSGITPVADLNYAGTSISRIVYSQNFTDASSNTNDAYGHGTHIAGILAGNGASSSGSPYTRTFNGIAPNARLINLRVLDANGQGSDSSVIAAIHKAIELKGTYNIRVINLSIGRPVFESYTQDPLCQAVEDAWKAGIVVIVAAGNRGRDKSMGSNGYGTISAPGNDPYVITVGAVKTMGTMSRTDDLVASYSSKGPSLIDHIVKPDLVAPGNQVVSLLAPGSTLATLYPQNLVANSYYQNTWGHTNSSSYLKMSGTSMAGPVVAGAAALLLQKEPAMTPDQVKARLMKTARKLFPRSSVAYDLVTHVPFTSYSDIFTVGAGYVDVLAALNNGEMAQGPALSPTVVFNPLTGLATVDCAGTIWSSSVVWGASVVWGTAVFLEESSVVWGTTVVWGSSAIWGTSVIGGTSDQSEAESILELGEN